MHGPNVERFSYDTLYLLSFSASNDPTVTVWRNKRIVYVLSTLLQLADNVQVTRMEGNNSAIVTCLATIAIYCGCPGCVCVCVCVCVCLS